MINAASYPSDRRRWLLVLLAMMELLYVGLALTFPVVSWLPRGRVSIGTATGRSTGATIALALLGCALYACYVSGAVLLWRGPLPRMTRWLWLGALAAVGALAWTYPVTSTDIFDYLFRSHMLAEYGANPYLALPNQFKTDPWFRYIGWPNAPSAYGPLWEIIGVQLARWGGTSLLVNVLLLKALAIGAWAACGCLIQHLAPQRWQQLCLYVWMWSPLALWEFAANGHNDGLLVVSLLAALLAVRRNKYWAAVLALTAGALFKFLPALFLPLVVLAWMRRERTWHRRFAIGAWSIVLFAVPVALLYAPFWDLPAQFALLSFADKLRAIAAGADATLRNMGVREGFLNAAPLAVLSYLLQTPASLAQINTLLMPAQPLTSEAVRLVVSQAGTIVLLVGMLWQSWQVWHHGRALIPAFAALMLWYVLVSSQWFQPWYVLWLLSLYTVRPERTSFAWLTAWALMAQGSYLLQYIVFPRLEIRGQTLEAQVWYVVAIYGLPLLVWMWMWWQRQRRDHTSPAQADTAY
jgi:hypothetical protein